MKKTVLAGLSVLLLISLLFNLSGCFISVEATNLMDGVSPRRIDPLGNLGEYNPDVSDFAIRLFKESETAGVNTLISP